MGGGLFGTPLYLNPKCLVFSGFVLSVYWLPHPKALEHRIVAAFLLATLAYVSLAWYDLIFDCNDRLRPTLLGWLSMPFKPAHYRKEFDELPLKYKKIVRSFDIAILVILLILVFSPYIF
jgi:UDP-N-acetylmuramyl pentapeptide phosphotransferase/UDP-N-acetylglucosamine-1-phosphate transferase